MRISEKPLLFPLGNEGRKKVVKLKSIYKTYLWGGTKIRDTLKKPTGELSCIAESWEVSTHEAGRTTIEEGEFAGKTLNEYFDATGWDILGEYGKKRHELPVLVKYIDAHQNLSIQVHPKEAYARAHENDGGKNEIWFVIGAEKGAFIYLGFNRQTSREEVRERIENNTLEEILNKIPVKRGDVFCIPAGTVHAIGAGCLICEVQQSSDVTYRLYDYGREDSDGKPRALHIEKALDVLDFSRRDPEKEKRKDLSSFGAHFSKMLPKEVHCSLSRYEAEGELTVALSSERIFFAVTYSGKGKICANDETWQTSVGDVFMIRGNALRVTGKCKMLLIGV